MDWFLCWVTRTLPLSTSVHLWCYNPASFLRATSILLLLQHFLELGHLCVVLWPSTAQRGGWQCWAATYPGQGQGGVLARAHRHRNPPTALRVLCYSLEGASWF